jgi:endonuclease/exonuclease/phosphatase family metal-dependent hydrolase
MDESIVRVMQLNVGSLLEPGWDERRHEVVAWVERTQPDVVCFQEVWESGVSANTAGWVVDQLAERGEAWHWAFAGAPFHPDLWPDQTMRFGSAVLSRWPISSTRYERLPVVHDQSPFVSQVPWELFSVRTAGLDVFSTHLAAAPHQGRDRVEQVLAIDRLVAEVRGGADQVVPGERRRTAMPAILCGDFNAEPDSDEIRFLSSLTAIEGRTTFFQDAWRVAGDGGPGYTQDWRTNPIASSLNVHRKRIDYIFVGDPFLRVGHAGRVLRAEVIAAEPITGVLASDHAGLVAEIVWPDRPSGSVASDA